MFTWECIKRDGKRLGTCMDGFLLGVCCSIQNEESGHSSDGSIWLTALSSLTSSSPSTTSSTTTTTAAPIILKDIVPTNRKPPLRLKDHKSKGTARIPIKSSRISDRPPFDPFSMPARVPDTTLQPFDTTTKSKNGFENYDDSENEINLGSGGEELMTTTISTEFNVSQPTFPFQSTTTASPVPSSFAPVTFASAAQLYLDSNSESNEETSIKDLKKKEQGAEHHPIDGEQEQEKQQTPQLSFTQTPVTATITTVVTMSDEEDGIKRPSSGSTETYPATTYTQLLNDTSISSIPHVPTIVQTSTSTTSSQLPDSTVGITDKPFPNHLGK